MSGERNDSPSRRPMKVGGFIVDERSGDPVVILTDESGERFLPIYIGRMEASSIALALREETAPRPLSHDLMKALLDSIDARVRSVFIHDLRGSTFYSRLEIEAGGRTIDLDARPSDGIALALRAHAPIFVSDRIPLAQARAVKGALPEAAPPGKEALRAFIDGLKPSDFLQDPPA